MQHDCGRGAKVPQNSRNHMAAPSREPRKCLRKMARPERFELPTSWFVAMRSIQLSYGRSTAVAAASRSLHEPDRGSGAMSLTVVLPAVSRTALAQEAFPSRISELPSSARPRTEPSADNPGRFGRHRWSPVDRLSPRGRASYHNTTGMQLVVYRPAAKFSRPAGRRRPTPGCARRCTDRTSVPSTHHIRGCRIAIQSARGANVRSLSSGKFPDNNTSQPLIAVPVVLPHHSRAFLHEFAEGRLWLRG